MKKLFITTYIFICAGLLFSGYLSAIKLFTKTCAFNESCPYFLGYPACWYGFVMYFVMFIVTSLYLKKENIGSAVKTNLAVSALGVIFSGSFAVDEIMGGTATGSLGLSTCVYGLIFYILIFVFSLITVLRLKKVAPLVVS